MEFSFEALEVYQKAMGLYRTVSLEERAAGRDRGLDLRRGILDLCQGIVTGAGCWSRDNKARHFQAALETARCLTPLVEGASIDGWLSAAGRETLRGEIEGLCRMLSSLARKTREWQAGGGKPAGGEARPGDGGAT